MTDWPDRLPGLDIKMALSQLGGKKNLLVRLLGMFSENHSQDVSNLLDAAKNQDRVAVNEINHALKGVTANLAADELSQLCIDLDTKLKNDQADISQELNAMPIAMETLLATIKDAVKLPLD